MLVGVVYLRATAFWSSSRVRISRNQVSILFSPPLLSPSKNGIHRRLRSGRINARISGSNVGCHRWSLSPPVRSVVVVLLAAFFCKITDRARTNPGNAGYILRRVGSALFMFSSVVVIGIVLLAWKSVCKPQWWGRILQRYWVLPHMLVWLVYVTTNHLSRRLKILDPET